MTGQDTRLLVTGDLRDELPGLRDLAVAVAVEAAAYVADSRAQALGADGAVGTKTTRTDVVTVVDRRTEELLRSRLAAARPGDAILGEELGATPRSARTGSLTWVVDPIDGTVNYLYGIAEYAVSVAVVVGDPRPGGAWLPVAGAVANAATGEVYHAHDGGGAVRRGSDGVSLPLAVSAPDDLGLVLLATGFGYDPQVRREQARALVEILPQVRDIRRGGSAALDLCHVAEGRVDAYAERGVNVWDVAAGWVVATEAGARVGLWSAGTDRPRGVLAAPAVVYGPLRELVTRSYAAAVGPPD